MTEKDSGQETYEAELRVRPKYHNGWNRPTWDLLPESARRAWRTLTRERK